MDEGSLRAGRKSFRLEADAGLMNVWSNDSLAYVDQQRAYFFGRESF